MRGAGCGLIDEERGTKNLGREKRLSFAAALMHICPRAAGGPLLLGSAFTFLQPLSDDPGYHVTSPIDDWLVCLIDNLKTRVRRQALLPSLLPLPMS